jgi:hypothetical protein
MFRVIGRLYENYCLREDAKSPPENWLANDPIHALLVRKTRDIAQNAQLVTILAPSSSSSFDDDDDEKEHENKDGKNGEERESFHPFLDEYLARGRS